MGSLDPAMIQQGELVVSKGVPAPPMAVRHGAALVGGALVHRDDRVLLVRQPPSKTSAGRVERLGRPVRPRTPHAARREGEDRCRTLAEDLEADARATGPHQRPGRGHRLIN